MPFAAIDRADEPSAIVVFAGTFVLQARGLRFKSLTLVGRLVERAHGIHHVEHVRVLGVSDNAGILCLRSRLYGSPGGAVIVGAVDSSALVRTVQHHLAVGRKYDKPERALQSRLHRIPSCTIFTAVHHIVVGGFVLAVDGDSPRAQERSRKRCICHTLRRADRRLVALGASGDVRVGGAVIVTDGRYQRASRNAHDIERDRFFNAAGLEFPYRHFRGNIICHKDAVAARDPGLLTVERIDFERARPVNRIARNPISTVRVDVHAIAIMLSVDPALAAVRRHVDAVAVVVAFLAIRIFCEVASGILAHRSDHNPFRILRVNRDAAVRTLVFLVSHRVAAFVRHGIARRNIFPGTARNIVLIDCTAVDAMRARTVGVGNVHVAVRNLRAVGHQVCGAARNSLPRLAAVVTHLQIVLGFRDADVDGLGRTVGVLALRFVEHHETDAVDVVEGRFRRARKGDFVNVRPGLAVVGTLVEALGAAAAENDVRHVRVHSQLFAGLAAHAVAVGEHFHVARIPGIAVIFTPEHSRPALAKIARPTEHVDALGVCRVERERLRTHEAHIVLAHPVHQRHPHIRLKVITVDATHVGAGVQQVFSLRVKNNSRHETTAVKADVSPIVIFGLGGGQKRCDRQNSKHRHSVVHSISRKCPSKR